MSYQKLPASSASGSGLLRVLRILVCMAVALLALLLFDMAQTPGTSNSSNLQASGLRPAILTGNAYAHPYVTTTPTITPTSTPLPCGLAWNVIDSPNPSPSLNYLFGVAAVSANDVWAVGVYDVSSQEDLSMIQHWDGNRWGIVASTNPSTSTNQFLDVAAVSANDVWAVGYYSLPSGLSPYQTLVEHWDGAQWSVVPSPNPSTSTKLRRLAVVSANDIWAVGYYANGGYQYSLTGHWVGGQ